MKLKIRFCNRFDIVLLCLVALGFLAFQAYSRTDRYRARELVDEWGGRTGGTKVGLKATMLAHLGLTPKPRREDWRPVLQDLKSVAEEAAPLLAERMGSDPSGMYALALANLGSPARPYLIEGLRSPDSLVREKSAYALGGLRKDALPITWEMLRALRDEDVVVSQSMARSLARIDRDVAAAAALPVIVADLHSSDCGAVFFATISLAELGPVNDASRAAIAEVEKGRYAKEYANMAKDRDRP